MSRHINFLRLHHVISKVHHSFSLRDVAVLAHIPGSKASMTRSSIDLVRMTGISKFEISRTIVKLDDLGLVVRKQLRNDRRYMALKRTPKAERLIDELNRDVPADTADMPLEDVSDL